MMRWAPSALQFLAAGLTVGAIYALVALGFSIIYNASRVINFAQGEFVMIGGMAAALAGAAGAAAAARASRSPSSSRHASALLLEKLAIEPARRAEVVTLIIITIGASIFLRGLAQLVWDKGIHALPPFSGDAPIELGGATIAAAEPVGARRDARRRRRAVLVLRPHAARQGDARDVAQPARGPARRHQRRASCCSRASAWPPRSARSPAC